MDDSATTAGDEQPVLEQGRRIKSSSLLWFISSRPYVPMADIRRRFGLATEAGTFLFDDEGSIHIGLPRQAAETLLDLKRKQKVGLQYDLEYATRIAVGAYPIRIRLSPPAPNARAFQPGGHTEPVASADEFADEPPAEGARPAIPAPTNGSPPVQQRRRGRRR